MARIIKMTIKFVNNGLKNIIKPYNLTEDDIKSISIGECMIIIQTIDGAFITVDYKLWDDINDCPLNETN